MSLRANLLIAATVPAFLACSSAPAPEGGPRPSTSNVITRAEIEAVDVRNAYDVVQRLRPRWLIVRSGPRSFGMETEVVVFQDEMLLGNQEALERIGTEGIYTIRYLDGATAKATLPGIGGRHVQGAIIISLRPPEP